VFFPTPTRGYGRPKDVDYRPAKQICQDCGVVSQCRAYADNHLETGGVWGGLTAGELRRLRTDRAATERFCELCGAAFVTSTSTRRHCSMDCRRTHRKGLQKPSHKPSQGPVFSGGERQTPPLSRETLPEAARSGPGGKSPAAPAGKIGADSDENDQVEAT